MRFIVSRGRSKGISTIIGRGERSLLTVYQASRHLFLCIWNIFLQLQGRLDFLVRRSLPLSLASLFVVPLQDNDDSMICNMNSLMSIDLFPFALLQRKPFRLETDTVAVCVDKWEALRSIHVI